MTRRKLFGLFTAAIAGPAAAKAVAWWMQTKPGSVARGKLIILFTNPGPGRDWAQERFFRHTGLQPIHLAVPRFETLAQAMKAPDEVCFVGTIPREWPLAPVFPDIPLQIDSR